MSEKCRGSKQEVETYLNEFLAKMERVGIIFLDRKKNQATLRMLGINEKMRKKILKSLHADDYVETIHNIETYGEMWVFGKRYDGTEIYIKITMGRIDSKNICISFHIAEYPIKYAFK